MLFRKMTCAIAAVIAITTCSACLAQSAPMKTKTRSVAAFKNGVAFFVREGDAALTDGWAMTEEVPSAALGTYWIGSPRSGVTIERLTAVQEEVSRTVPAISIQEMLAANVGKNVRVMVGEKVIEGKLLATPEDRKPEPDAPVYPVRTSVIPPSQSSLALIETSTGTVAVNKNNITWVEFEGTANSGHTAKEKVKRFRFKVNGAKESTPVTIAYLQKGVSWSPAYLVELLDEKKARLTLQGLLVNDVEEIAGADVYFVVGFPNFMFSNVLSPLSMQQSLTDFVGALGRPGESSYPRSSVMTQQIMYNYAGSMDDARSQPEFGYSSTQETPGAQEEDLFLYRMKDVSLKKGERAYYTVFSAEIPFEHAYEWEVPDQSRVTRWGDYDSSSRRNEQPSPQEQVWHKLRFTNTSKYPWTTAPAIAMSNGNPLAQDTLTYTSKGAKGDLKLTVATDISAKQAEMEKGRVPNAITINTSTYSKITADGKLTLKNFKSRPVTVTVKKRIVGEVVSTSPDGKVDKQTEAISGVNPTCLITWDVPLAAGEEKTLDYTYFVYVH